MESPLSELMERYAAGDDAAFSELYDSLAPRLYGFLQRQTRDRTLTEDLMQQTLLHIHRARGRYLPGADVLPWAFAIARRLLIDWHRAHRREVLPEQPGDSGAEEAEAPQVAADEVVQARQMMRELEQALASMPESQRAAYRLVREEGLSMSEAAQVLGTTVGAVKVRAHRAHEFLRRVLGHLKGAA